jgi:membrane-bound lytic murein transglycosylase D
LRNLNFGHREALKIYRMLKLRMTRLINETVPRILLLAIFAFTATPSFARAQLGAVTAGAPDQKSEIQQVISGAEASYQKGEQAYLSGEYARARREFDQALDAILLSSINVRSDEELSVYYRGLIERINRYQVAALEQKDGGFSEQRHEPSPLDKLASLSDSDLEQAAPDQEDLDGAGYNFRFTAAPSVKQFVGYFTRGRGRETLDAGLRRSARYRDMARRIFREEGVPTDLIWLAQVESGWNPYALSTAEARGIWQFMPSTGSRFGLSQSYWVDERSDPEKSTRAAARYLRWLSDRYHQNWELALAAYNTGEGNVDAAIARSGVRDFWRLHDANLLPAETRNYVPAILAVVAIAKNAKKYGFDIPPTYPYKYEAQAIAKQTDLHQLAKKLKVSYSVLADMNPELQRGVTPPGKHIVHIPSSGSATDGAATEPSAPGQQQP